jgi:hypothetical protein
MTALKDINQAWMSNKIRGSRFVKKAGELLLVSGQVRAKNFDGGATPNLGMESFIHSPHSPFAELADDLIGLDLQRLPITHRITEQSYFASW